MLTLTVALFTICIYLNCNVMHNFANKAKSDYEIVDGMCKKMSQLFQDTAKYYAFDPKKYTMEEFFNDMRNFINQYKVSSVLHIVVIQGYKNVVFMVFLMSSNVDV